MSNNRLPEQNLLITHYLQELYTLSSEIIKTFDELETMVNSRQPGMEAVFTFPNKPGKYFFVYPEVFPKIATIQVHSSNIKKILFATNRKDKESKYKYDYRVQRAKEVQGYFELNKVNEIRKGAVRNTLEHFDERLDRISLELWNGSIPKKYEIIASNFILSHADALVGNPYHLKCYIIDEQIYKNDEKESNIGEIVAEARYIQSITGAYQLVGSVIPIPPRG